MHFKRSRSFYSLVGCITILWSNSFAGSLPTLAVPPLGESQEEKASQAVSRALQSSKKIFVLENATVKRYLQSQKKGLERKTTPYEASLLLNKGQEEYRKVNLKEAISLFTKAKVMYRGQLFEEESFEGLRAAQLNLAMAYLGDKDEARAREEMREIVILDPEREKRELPEKLYPPNIRNLYKTVREEVRKKQFGNLDVVTSTPGVLVYVDGKSIGSTPARLERLPAGEHFIRVEMEGTEGFFGSKYIVAGENRMEPELKLGHVTNPLKYFSTVATSSQIDQHRAAFLDDMGVSLGADIFVFLTPEYAQVSAQLYDQRSQEVSPVVQDKTPEGLVTKLLKFIDADGYVVKGEETLKEGRDLAKKKNLPENLKPEASGTFSEQAKTKTSKGYQGTPWYQNRWVWIGLGGGLLLVGGGLFLFTDLGKSNATKGTLTLTIPGR